MLILCHFYIELNPRDLTACSLTPKRRGLGGKHTKAADRDNYHPIPFRDRAAHNSSPDQTLTPGQVESPGKLEAEVH